MLRLPGEIRNRIYDFTLGGNTWHIDQRRKLTCKTPKAERNDHRALLRVCRQIYNEARLLPWSLSDFQCETKDDLRNWLTNFPRECRWAITTITLFASSADRPNPSHPRPTMSLLLPRGMIGFQDFPGLRKLDRHFGVCPEKDYRCYTQLGDGAISQSTEEKVRVVIAQPYTPEEERQRQGFSFMAFT